MKQSGYKHCWCERCDRPTFHWLDQSRIFTVRECDVCGQRSGIDLKLWLTRFAITVAVALTLAMGFEPARHFLNL